MPSPSDAVLPFDPMDFLASARHYLPTRLYSVYPHPVQDPSEKRKYADKQVYRNLAICVHIFNTISRNADVPRALVKDMYTKS